MLRSFVLYSFSSKNPEEAELEDTLNQVVSLKRALLHENLCLWGLRMFDKPTDAPKELEPLA